VVDAEQFNGIAGRRRGDQFAMLRGAIAAAATTAHGFGLQRGYGGEINEGELHVSIIDVHHGSKRVDSKDCSTVIIAFKPADRGRGRARFFAWRAFHFHHGD
jgi:hypothetical protein